MGICKNQVSTCLLKDIVMIVHPHFFFVVGKALFSSTFLIASFDKICESRKERVKDKCHRVDEDADSKVETFPRPHGFLRAKATAHLLLAFYPQCFSEAESVNLWACSQFI